MPIFSIAISPVKLSFFWETQIVIVMGSNTLHRGDYLKKSATQRSLYLCGLWSGSVEVEPRHFLQIINT